MKFFKKTLNAIFWRTRFRNANQYLMKTTESSLEFSKNHNTSEVQTKQCNMGTTKKKGRQFFKSFDMAKKIPFIKKNLSKAFWALIPFFDHANCCRKNQDLILCYSWIFYVCNNSLVFACFVSMISIKCDEHETVIRNWIKYDIQKWLNKIVYRNYVIN